MLKSFHAFIVAKFWMNFLGSKNLRTSKFVANSHNTTTCSSDIQGGQEGGAGGALCHRTSGSKGPHDWRILTFGLQEML